MESQDATGIESSIPLLNGNHLLRSPEQTNPNPPESTNHNIDSASANPHRDTQFRIQRKPVNTDGQVNEKQPLPNAQPLKNNRAINPPNFRIFKAWWLEIGACILFLAFLGAVIATLYPHQGKPLPKWPYHLSVNTVISIYVVVLKSTMLLVTTEGLGQLKWKWLEQSRPLQDLVKYDNATRGPLGIFGLLWSLRLRHPLSSLGALLTLLILIVDPFTQQVIVYYTCDIPLSGINSTIPRTNIYLQRDTNQSQSDNSWVEPGLQAAVLDGIISPTKPVQVECPTGDCTFGEYSTVGYCSACMDITKDLSIQKTFVKTNYSDSQPTTYYFPNGTGSNTTFSIPGFLSNTNVSVTTSLPSGLFLSNGPGTVVNLTAMQVFPQGEEYRIEIILGKQFETLDPATGLPPSDCEKLSTNETWFCNGYGAASCTLSPCVRTYTSAVVAGVLDEKRVLAADGTGNNWGDTVPPPSPTASSKVPTFASPQVYVPYLGIVEQTCLNTHERQRLVDSGYKLDQNAHWLPYDLTFDPLYKYFVNGSQPQNLSVNASFPESMLVHECLYAFDRLFIATLWEDYMVDLFTGVVQGYTGNDSMTGIIERTNGSEALQTIYNYGNMSFDRVNEVFENVSDSITDFFRLQTLPKYNNPAQGLVTEGQTCLGVRWAWLAFPATLVLLTLAFFVAMLLESRPRGPASPPVWKSTSLALLFHGLELRDGRKINEGDLGRMAGVARGLNVRLEDTEDGLRLVELVEDEAKKCA